MNKDDYLSLVKKLTPKEDKIKNAALAFLVGGIIGLIGEIIFLLIMNIFHLTVLASGLWTSLIIIFVSCLLTGLGKFDDLVSKYKCGLIIPTTGFAHSVMSSALDYKRDGLITGLGSNFFKLAGSVILYGVISAFIICIVKVIFNV